MSDYCACDYGETADVWDVREVTARTSHVCTECGDCDYQIGPRREGG